MFDEEGVHPDVTLQVYHPPYASKHPSDDGHLDEEGSKVFSRGKDSDLEEDAEFDDRKPPARPNGVRDMEHLDSFPSSNATHQEDAYYHDMPSMHNLSPPYPLYSVYAPPPMNPYPPPYRSQHEYQGHNIHHHSMPPPMHHVPIPDPPSFPRGSPVTTTSSRAMDSFEHGFSSVSRSRAAAAAAPVPAVPDTAPRSFRELTHDRMYPSDEELSNAKHDRDRKAIIKWYERFRQLIAFKKLTGHCCVPQKYNKNRQLGSWVNKMRDLERQRKHGKQNFLNDRMLENLHLVGFVSAKPKGDPLWMLRYNQLKEYHAKVHHANVPTKYAANRALGRWVSTQRLQYRLYMQGQQSSMTRERVGLLEELGFVWDAAPDRDGSHDDEGDFDDFVSE
jgi:hypothetical protein